MDNIQQISIFQRIVLDEPKKIDKSQKVEKIEIDNSQLSQSFNLNSFRVKSFGFTVDNKAGSSVLVADNREDRQVAEFGRDEELHEAENKELRKGTLAEKVENDVEIANAFMEALNKKLRFVMDERANNDLIVQLVDTETDEVLKQYPPEEMLKLMVKIEDTIIGILVDDNA